VQQKGIINIFYIWEESKLSRIETTVGNLILPVLDGLGYELVDIEFKKEGSQWHLRIYIDKPEGINLEDCEKVSYEISDLLDEADPIEQSYILEVSSPGLDRPLKKPRDYERAKGTLVEVKLYKAIDGKKNFEGILEGLVGDELHLIADNQEHVFKIDEIALVKPVIKI